MIATDPVIASHRGASVQRSTARNDETMSALDFLKWHRATFQQAAARNDVMCVAINPQGILPLWGHSGHALTQINRGRARSIFVRLTPVRTGGDGS